MDYRSSVLLLMAIENVILFICLCSVGFVFGLMVFYIRLNKNGTLFAFRTLEGGVELQKAIYFSYLLDTITTYPNKIATSNSEGVF